MSRISEFENRMLNLKNKKQRELDRRGKRANELLQKSEKKLVNKEQWEAYQKCITFQHNKMMGLVHELLIIRSVLEGLERKQIDDDSSPQE